jgi:hypothetical protein
MKFRILLLFTIHCLHQYPPLPGPGIPGYTAKRYRRDTDVAQYDDSVHIYFFSVNTAFFFILELYPGGASAVP